MDNNIALLIDAENISVKYIDVVIKELNQYGILAIQRMYGDFSSNLMGEWAQKGMEYAIVPIHQSRYTSSKNASDIMLVIDAMDILFKDKIDIFCIVSSDSDFTRLASRIREGGKKVIGMGLSNASKTFITSCNEYKFLDKIIEEEADDNDIEVITGESAITPLIEIKRAIYAMLREAEDKGERLNMGSTKSQLKNAFPDFDERNYGYSMFRKLVEEETKFKVEVDKSTAFITRRNTDKKVNIEETVRNYIQKCADSNMDLGRLGRDIQDKYPGFKVKEYGYSKLSKYIQSIPGVEIITKSNKSHISVIKENKQNN